MMTETSGTHARTPAGGDERTIAGGLREHTVPAAVAVVATLALLGLGIATDQSNWQVYAVVLVLGGIGMLVLDRRVGLSQLTFWGLTLFGIGHLAGGMVAVGDETLYGVWIIEGIVRYDNLQHAVGFGFVGRATWEALRGRLAPRDADAPAIAAWIVVLAAAAFGAVNEIIEWILTLTLAATNVGGYDNTARDLVANLVGGLAMALYTRSEVARARPRPAGRSLADDRQLG